MRISKSFNYACQAFKAHKVARYFVAYGCITVNCFIQTFDKRHAAQKKKMIEYQKSKYRVCVNKMANSTQIIYSIRRAEKTLLEISKKSAHAVYATIIVEEI